MSAQSGVPLSMICRWLVILAAMFANQALVAAPPHPSLPSAGDAVPVGLGVNIHFTDAQPGEMEMLTAAGFRWIRMDLMWAATERERGKYDFSAYDRLAATLAAHKLRALVILCYGNELYEPRDTVTTPEAREAFARWAAAAADHFQGRGFLWEIWNEPNGRFWKPHADVKQYAALALATSKAIRQAAPREAIIGPASLRVDRKFIEGCCQAGLLEYWDAVSVHPYRQTAPETAAPDYQKLRRLIARYAPPGKSIPILCGEWGYSCIWPGFDEAKQGRYLARQWLVNLASGIPLSIWYDWHDDGPDPNDAELHYGTVAFPYHAGQSPVYTPKPAYLAAQTLTSVLDGFRFRERLDLGNPADYALLFGKGDESRLAVWSTSPTPHEVTIPWAASEYEVVSHTGERAGSPLRVSGNSLVLTISDAPQYLVTTQLRPDSVPTTSNGRAENSGN